MVSINLSDELVAMAKHHAKAFSRSTPKQIEHWAKIGKLVEENPDLPLQFVKDIMLALQQVEDGDVEPFIFTELDPKEVQKVLGE